MEIELGEMTMADLPRVSDLALHLGYSVSLDDLRQRFSVLNFKSDTKLFVAREKGQVLGWIQISKESETLISASRAMVNALVVDEKTRGKKIGAQLLKYSEAWVRDQGLKIIRVGTNVKREDAHRFYIREGYRIEKSWHLMLKDLT